MKTEKDILTFLQFCADNYSIDIPDKVVQEFLESGTDEYSKHKPINLEEIQELPEEAKRLILRLLPPETFGECEYCDRLYAIIGLMEDLITRK